MKRLLLCTLLPPLALLALAQGETHVHGLVRLDIAIEPGRLTLQLDAPQQALLGHERAPRNAAERQAAAALLARLRGGQPLWQIDPALQCSLHGARVEASLLEAAAADRAAAEHAEVSASYEYRCSGPGALRQLDVGALLDAFKGIVRIDARIAGAAAQHKASVKRPARLLSWGR